MLQTQDFPRFMSSDVTRRVPEVEWPIGAEGGASLALGTRAMILSASV